MRTMTSLGVVPIKAARLAVTPRRFLTERFHLRRQANWEWVIVLPVILVCPRPGH
jgi:hypothetical protein